MPIRATSLTKDTSSGIDREIGSQYDNVKTVAENIDVVVTNAGNIESINTVSSNIVSMQVVASIEASISALANMQAALVSLYDDKEILDSIYADKATLDSLYADKVILDSLFADKTILDSLYADKTTLDSIYADKVTLDSIFADKVELDRVYDSIGAVDRLYASISSIDRVYASIDSVDITASHIGNVDAVASIDTEVVNVSGIAADVTTVSGISEDVSIVSGISGDVEYLAAHWTEKQDRTDYLDSVNQYLGTTDSPTFVGVTADSIQLTGGVGTQGTITWNADEETLDVVQNSAVLQLGQELQVHCRNTSGSVINDGTVVMATGTLGASGRITIAPYDGVSDVKYVIGVTTEPIGVDEDGKVTYFGKVRGVDTSTWAEGTVLYASVDGMLTEVAPTSGIKLSVAFVISSKNNGTIMVRVTNRNELTSYGELIGIPTDLLVDGDIGVNVQAYDANIVSDGSYVHTDNNYTTTEKNKLAGIEGGATADQSASEVPYSGVTSGLAAVDVQSAIDKLASSKADIADIPALETTTSLSLVANVLSYVDEDGTTTNMDLSLYLDDSNLARIISGTYDTNTQELVFTRDDASEFRIDASMFFDDTNLVTSVNGYTGVVMLAKSDVGLGNVDNTSDINKPISTAAQNALDLKADITYVDTKKSEAVSEANTYTDTKSQEVADVAESNANSYTDNEIVTVRSEAATQALLENNAEFKRSGYTKEVSREDRWLETNTPNVIVDKVSEPIVIDGVIYDRLGDELVTNGDFTNGTTGWDLVGCSLVDGKIKFIGDGSFQRITQYNNQPIDSYVKISVYATAQIGVHSTSSGTSFNLTEESTNIWVGYFKYISDDLMLYTYNSSPIYIDNISVKELKQATLPDAPFAPTSTDELLDDKVNGLTTQSAHSKGDIVVTGNELVTNGTFDTDVSGWDYNGASDYVFDAGTIKVQPTNYAGGDQVIYDTIVGETYVISFDITATTVGTGRIYIGYTGSSALYYNVSGLGVGSYTYTIVSLYSNIRIGLATTAQTGDSVNFDNISVKLKDSIYQATEDTTAGTLLSDTTKFQKLDFVSRQDLIYLTTTGYKTKKGLHSFTDKELVEGGSDLIASRYGYSKLGDGLYEIDGEKATALQVSGSRLNGGGWHPMFNGFGTRRYTKTNVLGNRYWHQDATVGGTIDNIYINFIDPTGIDQEVGYGPASGYVSSGLSGRPDSKFYDKIYLKGENGLAPHSLFYAKDDHVLPRDKFGLMSGSAIKYFQDVGDSSRSNAIANLTYPSSNGLAVYIANIESKYGTAKTGLGYVYVLDNGDGTFMFLYTERVWTGTSGYYWFKLHPYYIHMSQPLAKSTSSNIFLLHKQHPQLLTYAENLTTDLIGNPANYPSSWKSFLAGGGVTSVNPLLVGQDGTDYLSSTILSGMIMSSKIQDSTADAIYSTDSVSWTNASNRTVDSIANTLASGLNTANATFVIPYTAYNQPMVKLDPQKIKKVTPKSIATNSHSVYKDSLITWLATDKIAVGNGSNGYESKVLENIQVVPYHHEATVGATITVKPNEYVYVDATVTSATSGVGIYKNFTDNTFTFTVASTTPFSAGSWGFLGMISDDISIGTTPQHSTHDLDNSNSSACKYFEVEFEFADGSKGEGIFTQEIIYNTTDTDYADDTGDYGQLTNGTDTDLLGQTIKTGFYGRRK